MKRRFLKKIFIITMPLLFSFSLASCGKEPNNHTISIDDPIIPKYIVSFDTDGGNEIDKAIVEENKLLDKPNDPIKDKYTFLGWYLDDEIFDFNNPITKNITLKAKWRDDSVITLNRLFENHYYDIETNLESSYFNSPSSEFNNDIARFAFNLVSINLGDEIVQKFYHALDFSDIDLVKENGDSYQGVSYTIGKRNMGDYDLVAVSIRGMRYYKEWALNFDLGASGNHQDFNRCANIVYESLKNYFNKYNLNNNTKILISGYSRSGAISNILGDKLMRDTNKLVTDDNLYVYTFEAPMSIEKENAVAYPNVFNIINSADFVTYVAPEEYNFKRCGIDIDIYNSNIANIVKEFDNDYNISEFKANFGSSIKSYEKLYKELIKKLLSYKADPNSNTYLDDLNYEIDTREKYDANLSPTIQYLFRFVFNTNNETLNKMFNGLINLANNDTLKLIGLFTDSIKLHDFVASYLIEDNITYDDNELQGASDKIVGTILRNSSLLLFIYSNSNNLSNMPVMHSPLVNYILLDYYLKNN